MSLFLLVSRTLPVPKNELSKMQCAEFEKMSVISF